MVKKPKKSLENLLNEEELLWQKAIISNPAFSFLGKDEENIYSINDGEVFND